ncbi:MAG: NAD+ synthase [Candidatus Omnitrophica bacterium]|nr:NAD+ synthase [Candidatus Omnitrophota bacterium]
MRVGLGQINPTVGDFSGNLAKILAFIEEAEKKGCDLAIFPELAISGYPVWDLAIKKSFIRENLHSLETIAKATRRLKVSVVVGYIDHGPQGSTKSRNALAWIEKGKVRLRQYKSLLPTYDVFLEEIFFEPGEGHKTLSWRGIRLGTAICEDIWDQQYSIKPLQSLSRNRAQIVVAINASPYHKEKARLRDELLKRQSKRYGFSIIYVNQIGSQDDLIFDGRSLVVDRKGRVLFRAPAFEEGLFVYDWDLKEKNPKTVPLPASVGEPSEIYQALVLGVRDYVTKNKFKSVVIGLSGGIDSALTATLACDALGSDRVLGVTMPGVYSSEGSWKDSEELAKNLGIEFRVYPIKEKYNALLHYYQEERHSPHPNPLPILGRGKGEGEITLTMENLQARLRGLELMYISNEEGRLVLTTGNKSELAMGYCTLYGDMAGGLCVLGDVYKTDVYRLARYRNQIKPVIPQASIEKPPSAELRPNQKDQDSLPPYEILDEILKLYIEKNLTREEILKVLMPQKVSLEVITDAINRVDHNEYKRRQAPPILRVTQKAWFGRRMPITNRFMG